MSEVFKLFSHLREYVIILFTLRRFIFHISTIVRTKHFQLFQHKFLCLYTFMVHYVMIFNFIYLHQTSSYHTFLFLSIYLSDCKRITKRTICWTSIKEPIKRSEVCRVSYRIIFACIRVQRPRDALMDRCLVHNAWDAIQNRCIKILAPPRFSDAYARAVDDTVGDPDGTWKLEN